MKQRIMDAGLSSDGKLFGVEFQRCVAQGRVRIPGPQDLCGDPHPTIDDARFATNVQFIAIQAYADAWGSPHSPNNVNEVNAIINTAKSRIPADKKLILIGQGYDRNGAWTNTTDVNRAINIETLRDLQEQYYLQAYPSGSRVLAVLMFSYARWSTAGKVSGGARVHPELLHPHVQMAERIHGFRDGDFDGMPDMWERQWGLQVGLNDANLDPDVDGLTNLTEFQQKRHPAAPAANRRYLAEGSQGGLFTTWIGVANANPQPARVLLRFSTGGGSVIPLYVFLPPGARTRVYADTVGLQNQDFSIETEANVRVTVDRTMRWDASGYGGHSETAVDGARFEWYFAEGVTSDPFALYYLVLNPNAEPVTVQITYVLPFSDPIVHSYSIAPNSRRTIGVDGEPGLAGTDVAAIVRSVSGGPIIAERAQYLNVPQLFGAGHVGVGAPAPSPTWFLAEGSTGSFFDLYVLILNPNNFPVSVTANFLRGDGMTVTKTYTIAARRRFTIAVDGEDPLLQATEVSTTLSASAGIVAERVMWWPQGAWHEAHCSLGVTQAGTRWLSGDGEEGGFAAHTTYLLIANVAFSTTSVRVTLLNGENRLNTSRVYNLNARSRISLNVGAEFGLAPGRRVALLVESLTSGNQIVVERAVYWNAGGVTWAAGTSAPAERIN